METRFSRFMKNRRSRMIDSSPRDSHFRPPTEQSSPSPKRPSILKHPQRAFTSPTVSHGHQVESSSLQAFSYDSCAHGKPPTFIGKAQPGNGPIRLQANRRLSSGELVATTQEGALQGIREGDYVVGRKERSSSQSQSRPTSHVTKSRVSSGISRQRSPLASPSPTQTSPRAWPISPVSQQGSLPPRTPRGQSITYEASSPAGPGLTPRTPTYHSRPSLDTRGDSKLYASRPSLSRDSFTSQRTYQDMSATLLALKKAEYSRMVDLYGPEAVALNLVKTSSNPSSPMVQNFPPLPLDPLRLPHHDYRDYDLKPPSRLSGASDSYYEESSGTDSPQRASLVSSQAGSSSTTAPTILSDEGSTASREEIRNMVEQIRATYLVAFETHASSSPKTKPRKKRRKPKTLSPTLASFDQAKTTPVPGRQTWHPDNQQTEVSSKRRVNSQPVSSTGRLSPIPASPPRVEQNEIGVKRADSTTLGTLLADMTRANIKAQILANSNEQTTNDTPRPSTPNHSRQEPKDSWLSLESDSPSGIRIDARRESLPYQLLPEINLKPTNTSFHSTSNSQDSFEAIYQDIFGKDADDFWSSSASLSGPPKSSLCRTYYNSNEKRDTATEQFSTPRKPLYIPAIRESPEYTRLADPRCPEGQFI